MLGPDAWNPFRHLATQSVFFATLLFASSLIAKPSPSATPNEQILRAQLFLDGSNFKQLPDLGFKKSEGNEILAAGIPLAQSEPTKAPTLVPATTSTASDRASISCSTPTCA